jgi:hypothetical protein
MLTLCKNYANTIKTHFENTQFTGEPGVDAGGLEREWFMLVCAALFDAAAGLFTAVPETGAFDISSGSGVANDMHTDYFQFTGRQAVAVLSNTSVIVILVILKTL